MADRDERMTQAPRRSVFGVVREHPFVLLTAALLGAAAVGAVLYLFDGFFADEEAPIRVRNGSLELNLLSKKQKWEEQGSSGNYSVKNAERFKEEFDVTVAVRGEAACGPSKTATGKDIVLIYTDEAGKDWEARIESAGFKTMVKPNGFKFALDGNQKLTYGTPGQGLIKQIAVGTGGNPAVLCSFTKRDQLDHLIILNVPQ